MPHPEMPKAYEPGQYEDAIYAAWEKSGLFNPDNLKGKPYAIMMPPPNVTGVLHLGHALENSLMDAMARFQRLSGKKVLLVPGTDHAAIATQAKVEKQLMKEGMANPRQELGREALVQKIREFAAQSMATIVSQVRKVGSSADWSRLAYTFDEKRNVAVNELFARMYKDGLIYRGFRVVNWSVKGQSTCSDDEIETVERPAKLYTFKYAKDFPIIIATTRPETKLGDTAVAVHPDDERYAKFIGKTFVVDVGAAKPLSIKVIADEGVEKDFGTGALGVTPAHSAIDFAMYEKQKATGTPIEIIQVIGADGKMTKEAGKDYAGLSVEDARAKFVEWLKSEGLLVKEEDIVQNVGTSDRYGDVIEAIPMTQWWLDMNKVIPSRKKSLRDLMREAVTTGLDGKKSQKVTITPERFTKLYLDRVDNLRDWCLSRQLWWGHRIPAWYRGEEIYVGTKAPEGNGWMQDEDTLDTWFSSGSWTFSTLGWPEKSKDLKTFHPTSWITMGYEILYLWLMRMILMSTYALGEIPFKDAYIHGMLRDKDGKKFSKSSGNGIDPIEVIKEYGCDALRLSLLVGISPGNDAKYYTEKIEGARNFVNKLWNISRFIDGSTGGLHQVKSVKAKTLADKWILSRLNSVVARVGNSLEQFDFSLAAEVLREFTWTEFADWYLEVAKIEKGKEEILNYILERLLVLWHPFMPFVTEEIWKQYQTGTFLMVAKWPKKAGKADAEAEKEFAKLQEIIVDIRNLRATNKIAPTEQLGVEVMDKKIAKAYSAVIFALARAREVDPATDKKSVSSTNVVVYLPSVDAGKERVRLTEELEQTRAYVVSLDGKLGNVEFTSKAPAKVVDGMRAKKTEAEAKAAELEKQLKNID